ncbi:hypothetical protein D3C72_2577140 [compost metagenome]
MSGVRTEDEGLYTVQHRYWLDVMKKAVAEQSAEAANEATDTTDAAAGSAA